MGLRVLDAGCVVGSLTVRHDAGWLRALCFRSDIRADLVRRAAGDPPVSRDWMRL